MLILLLAAEFKVLLALQVKLVQQVVVQRVLQDNKGFEVLLGIKVAQVLLDNRAVLALQV
jgi:hypothetical protein